MGVFQGTQERDRNSSGKRAIRVRATEGLLYLAGGETNLAADLAVCRAL